MKDNLNFKNIFKRETKLASYIVICLTIVVLSLSYAMFFKVEGNSKNQVVEAGDLVFTYENTSQTITSEGNSDCFMPMSADETSIYLGICDYRLSVQNTGSLKGAYTLRLVANEENTIEANKIKVIVRKQEGEVFQIVSGYENGKTVSELTDGIIIEDEEMETNSTVVYSVSLIIDESVATEEDTSKVLSYKIEGTGLVHESQDIHTEPPTFESTLAECIAEGKNGATCLTESANLNTEELAYDETVDNNLRYIGSNPNNYVLFNNELWRIIGVFNNIDDGTGTKETRLKIIRSEPIGKYSWDNKATGTGSSISPNGSNNWSDSTLQQVLDSGAYWNRTSGECPYGQSGATTPCDFTNNGLTEEAKSMISDAKWNLGGTASFESSSNGLVSHWYTYERSTTVYSGRPTEWTGKIGLMYPSDYGYATSGGSTANRETCLNTALYNWRNSDVSDCNNNDWLYTGSHQWTLTPYASLSSLVFNVFSSGRVNYSYANDSDDVFPALYLNSNVKISGGEGTESSPFTLSL